MYNEQECPELAKVEALATRDDVREPDDALLTHLSECNECQQAFEEHRALSDAVLSLPLEAFLRWFTVNAGPDEVICGVDLGEGDLEFVTFDVGVDVASHLTARYEDRLVAHDPALRELVLDEIERRRRAPAPARRKPRVGVIMPTYDQAEVLGRALRSALEQSYPDFCVIVVDDGSRDRTVEVLSGWTNNRLRYCSTDKNSGPAAARNLGIAHALKDGCEVIAFLDSDDQWYRDYLPRMVDMLIQAPYTVGGAYCDMWVESDSSIGLHRSPEIELGRIVDEERGLCGTGIHMSSLVLRAECFAKAESFANDQFFDPDFKALEDVHLVTRLARDWAFRHVEEPLVRKFTTPKEDIPEKGQRRVLDGIRRDFEVEIATVPLPPDCDSFDGIVSRHSEYEPHG